MDKFKLVHGDINIYPKQNYPNHSWVEKDNYVYDPTDGFKYEKEIYYKLYEPQVINVYDETSVKNYDFYQKVINKGKEVNLKILPIILQYIEEQENIEESINHDLLLNEIEQIRKKYNITIKYNKQIIDEYRKIFENNRSFKH